MADQISFEPPRGMRDFYPEDMVWRNKVFDAFRAAGEAAGFEPYDRSTTSTTRATATSPSAPK